MQYAYVSLQILINNSFHLRDRKNDQKETVSNKLSHSSPQQDPPPFFSPTVSNITIKITIFFYNFFLLKSSHKFTMLLLVSKTNINSLHFSTTKMINLEAHNIMMKNTSIFSSKDLIS
jgi:hypothetical protein